jgi:hypothetical protein
MDLDLDVDIMTDWYNLPELSNQLLPVNCQGHTPRARPSELSPFICNQTYWIYHYFSKTWLHSSHSSAPQSPVGVPWAQDKNPATSTCHPRPSSVWLQPALALTDSHAEPMFCLTPIMVILPSFPLSHCCPCPKEPSLCLLAFDIASFVHGPLLSTASPTCGFF